MKPEKQLYQWDVNQHLTGINPAALYVDYTIGNDVIRLETDGTRCRIPDEVLQEQVMAVSTTNEDEGATQ